MAWKVGGVDLESAAAILKVLSVVQAALSDALATNSGITIRDMEALLEKYASRLETDERRKNVILSKARDVVEAALSTGTPESLVPERYLKAEELLANWADKLGVQKWLKQLITTQVPVLMQQVLEEKPPTGKKDRPSVASTIPRELGFLFQQEPEGDYAVIENGLFVEWAGEQNLSKYDNERYKERFDIYVNLSAGEVLLLKRPDGEATGDLISPGRTFKFCTFLLLLLRIGSSWDCRDLAAAVHALKRDSSRIFDSQGRLKPDARSTVNKSISVLKSVLANVFGKKTIEKFIYSGKHNIVFVRGRNITELSTCLVLDAESLTTIREALKSVPCGTLGN